jgi:hypothetical protein
LWRVEEASFVYQDEESYLLIDSDREAFLVFQDGSTQHIGKFTPVSARVAIAAEGYTYSPVLQQYYTAVKEEC